ncbi:hypothetical protein OIN60_01675 [Paenibacillus sp. P96]|uniref:Lipoprotein n=1 Tax=Paenibacillus zeirhizosphaerae TaxID=2987519 RepID=A0ABT9FM82_9BACL|nr:hypothetical protein [Paenibacillus sp. P96]MDP4095502.1 hypothetical protein [Paenibacillus sp. P96]
MKRLFKLFGVLAFLLVAAGCGQDESTTFSIFIIDNQGDPTSVSQELEQKLQQKLGEGGTTVEVVASPMYDRSKLLVEYVAGEHDIFILPEEDMRNNGSEGGNLPLDEYFDKKAYPRGVFEGAIFKPVNKEGQATEETVTETHLYGIPADQMALFKDVGYASSNLFATIPPRTGNLEEAVSVLQALAE